MKITVDGITLDSPEQALFWGLCRLWKIPVERADRYQAVAFTKDIANVKPDDPIDSYDLVEALGSSQVTGTVTCWYCPDFYMPDPALDLWVEVKGAEDDDDPARWSAWREPGRELAVIRREELLSLCQASRPAQLAGRLRLIAAGHLEALPFA